MFLLVLFYFAWSCLELSPNKEVHDDGNKTTISNASCFSNDMFGVCYLLDEKFGIKYDTMAVIHSYTAAKMILHGCHYD